MSNTPTMGVVPDPSVLARGLDQDSALADRTSALIEIRISSLPELLNSLDPAPVHERAVDLRAERYMVGCVKKHRQAKLLRLRVHAPASLRAHADGATDAVHEHFRRAHALGERNFRRRLRIGAGTLAIASGILGGSFWLRRVLSGIAEPALAQGLGEGLLILGWVAMWRPVEILLFEHWESHLDHRILERLAGIPVEWTFQPDPAREPRPNLPFAGERT